MTEFYAQPYSLDHKRPTEDEQFRCGTLKPVDGCQHVCGLSGPVISADQGAVVY